METATTSGAVAGAFYFGLVTALFYETWDFYTERLGFRTLAEDDHRVLLVHPSGVRLGILRHETDGQHVELVNATDGRGLWLNLDVVDVDAMYQSLSEVGVPGVQPLTAGPHGARSFTLHDPNGVLIRIARAQPVSVAWGELLELAKNAAC